MEVNDDSYNEESSSKYKTTSEAGHTQIHV